MIRQYLLLSWKVLLRRKFFTFVSIFGVAFTLLVLTVVTAVADHEFAAAPPESRQARMLGVYHATMYGRGSRMNSSGGYRLFDRYARNLPGVEALSLVERDVDVPAFVGGRRETVALKRTDANFWRILDFSFRDGRPFDETEVRTAAHVAVVTRSAAARLVPDRAPVGGEVEIDGQSFHIVGLVDDVSALRWLPYADVWVPYTTAKTADYRDQMIGDFYAVALASTPANLPEIRDEFNGRLRRAELPDPREFSTIVAPFETKLEAFARTLPFADRTSDQSQLPKLILLAVTAGLLFALLPAVNLVNVNVSRILERASEIGVRKAFGASSATLVLQFIVENVVLTSCGAVIAFALSWAVLRALNASGLIAHAALSLNVRVFGWGVGMAILFALLSGVYPAWRMSRLRPVDALRGAVR